MAAIQRASLGFDFFESRFEILSRNPGVKFQAIFAPDLGVDWRRRGQGRSDGCAIKGAIPEQSVSKAQTPGSARDLVAVVAKDIAIEHRRDCALPKGFG